MRNALAYYILCRVWTYLLKTGTDYPSDREAAMAIIDRLKYELLSINDAETIRSISMVQRVHEWNCFSEVR